MVSISAGGEGNWVQFPDFSAYLSTACLLSTKLVSISAGGGGNWVQFPDLSAYLSTASPLSLELVSISAGIPRLLCLPVDSVSLEYGVGVNLGWWRGELVPHLPQQYVSLPHQPAQSYDTVIIVQKKKLSGILYIFLSLNSGQVPTEWRTATVIPIFKKGKNQQQQTTARSLSFV